MIDADIHDNVFSFDVLVNPHVHLIVIYRHMGEIAVAWGEILERSYGRDLGVVGEFIVDVGDGGDLFVVETLWINLAPRRSTFRMTWFTFTITFTFNGPITEGCSLLLRSSLSPPRRRNDGKPKLFSRYLYSGVGGVSEHPSGTGRGTDH